MESLSPLSSVRLLTSLLSHSPLPAPFNISLTFPFPSSLAVAKESGGALMLVQWVQVEPFRQTHNDAFYFVTFDKASAANDFINWAVCMGNLTPCNETQHIVDVHW